MRYILLVLVLTMTLVESGSAVPVETRHGGWNLEAERDGIKIYTRQIIGSKLKQVRAVVSLKAPIETILGVLTDYKGYSDWMNNVTESYVVDHPSDSVHYVFRHEDAPWPVQNRYHVDKMVVSQGDDQATLSFKSMPNYLDKSDEAIEVQRYEGEWRIQETDRGLCEVELVFDENPGGFIPTWLVNYLAVDAPYRTMANLRDRVATLIKS